MFFEFFEQNFNSALINGILCDIICLIGCDFMKKIISAALAVIIMLSLCSCSKKTETALVISGTEISTEVFAYYLDKVLHRPADYGLTEESSEKDFKLAAIDECKKYVAVSTEFRNIGLSLSASDKVSISDDVNNLWVRFSNHYNEIGISKQTLTKILTAEAYEDAIFTATYDRGISNKAAEKELTDYFYSNYVCFRTVCAYFTSADGMTEMTQLEKNELAGTFEKMKNNAGDSVQKFSDTVTAAGYTLSDSILLKKGSDGYPEGFFEKVSEQKDGTVSIITESDCIFAVWKENLKEKGESVYSSYRSSCISDLYSSDSQKKTDEIISSLDVEEKRAVDRIVNKMI